MSSRTSKPGKLAEPFPVEHCANVDCARAFTPGDEAYLYKILDTGKLCVFCDDCARHVEMNNPTDYALVAL